MAEIQTATVRQLAQKIKGYGGPPQARFAFFLGAGCSVTSGVPSAELLIREFKQHILKAECPAQFETAGQQEEWFAAQPWFNPDKPYSSLFERFEPKEYGRQQYLEKLIDKAKLSFGYIVLANLMQAGYVNTIITTNFDDLVASACAIFTDIRPIVFAYGSFASEMRVRVPRPRILKLHGDYLYSALKNTEPELAEPDPNMARQVQTILSEYGLVVMGYSGGDESVMNILDTISERNDLYWCTRRGSALAPRVQEFLEDKRGFLVEIEGFDELLNELRETVGFDAKGMLGSISARQERMIELLKEVVPDSSKAQVLREIADALDEQAKGEQAQAVKNRALHYFVKALEAAAAGNTADAEAAYRTAIELNPQDAKAYNNLGVLLADTNRPADAEAAYRTAIELNPQDGKAYVNLGVLLADTNRPADAEAAYRKAIELNPQYANAYNNLGLLLFEKLNRPADAEAAYRKAIELDPQFATAYDNLGLLLHEKLHRPHDAEAAYRTAIELNPQHANAYYNLGNLLADTNRPDDAEAAYRKAIELNPQLAQAYGNLGNLLLSQNRPADAEAAYQKVIELNPQDAQAYNNLGNLLQSQNRPADAEAAYQKVIELNPQYAQAYNNLGNLLQSQNRPADAEAAFRTAIELNPQFAEAYVNLGALLQSQNRPADAEAAFRTAIELNPQLAQAYGSLAYLLRMEHRFAEAEPFYRRAVELEPEDPRRYVGLILLLRQTHRPSEALPLAEKYAAIAPNDPDAIVAMAGVLKELDRDAEAAPYLDQARGLVKEGPWYSLACIESIAGNTDAALDALQRAMDALQNGSGDADYDQAWAKEDPDLAWIRDVPRFAEIVK